MVVIHFIVNPVSGKGNHNLNESYLRNFFSNADFQIVVRYSKYKGHAIALANEAVSLKPDYIVACGGDGTINEVASALVNSDVLLGVIPVGSGNGLASNLGISKNVQQALAVIKSGKRSSIDVGVVNEHYFFSNMGIGIDSMIIKKYSQSSKRSLFIYMKAAMSAAFEFIPKKAMVAYGSKLTTLTPFMLFISNSNQMGYGMSLTPKASLDDGWLDLFVVPNLSFFQKLILGYHVVSKNVTSFSKGTHTLIQSLKLEEPDTIFMDIQIDGEYHNLKTNKIHVSLIREGLKVIVP